MAKGYEIEINAHPSVYQPQERQLKIYFSEPERGFNKHTGVLLLIAGFGGHANSNVYKKMRDQFADDYNLLTIQCDYFGWQYMQGIELAEDFICDFNQFMDYPKSELDAVLKAHNDIQQLLEITKRNQRDLSLLVKMKENWSNFNDMGMMQAIDNITAVMAVLEIVKEKGNSWNESKVIVYGHSHGAYLAHLCNLFAPEFFSLMIDNSAWMIPGYLKTYRSMILVNGIELVFDYLVRQLEIDEEIYDLRTLYRNFKNTCTMIAFHGTEDHLVNYKDKKKLIDSIPKATFYLVDRQNLDNEIFRSTAHGLDADFIKMFQVVRNNYSFPPRKKTALKNVHFHTSKADYYIHYENGRPELKCVFPE